MGDDVVITYETLFEMLRRERSRGDLQELDQQFFGHVTQYLQEKKSMGEKHEQEDLLGEEAKQKIDKQLFNIKKLIRQLYELREKKIVDMALNKSRTQSVIVDEKHLLPEEKGLYDHLIAQFNGTRNEVLYAVLNGTSSLPEPAPEKPKVDLMTLHFLEDVDEFAGDDMKFYGPFHKGQTGDVPEQLAKILLHKGVAEEQGNSS